MEEGTMNQGMRWLPEARKGKEMNSSLEAAEGT